LRYGQLSHWFGDFRADLVTRCVSYSLNPSRQPSTRLQAWTDASYNSIPVRNIGRTAPFPLTPIPRVNRCDKSHGPPRLWV
jgi:hypothetical protein